MSSMFPLKEATITVRGQKVRIRELTRGEHTAIARGIIEDKFRGPALFAAAGSVEPKFDEKGAEGMPADVVNAIAREVMKISGMGGEDDEKEEPGKT